MTTEELNRYVPMGGRECLTSVWRGEESGTERGIMGEKVRWGVLPEGSLSALGIHQIW